MAGILSAVYTQQHEDDRHRIDRMTWGHKFEFLMSCIATTVGLGNVWRFPFVAYQNGGGAFIIPYIIVLLLIGKPMYFLEGVLGQFSSRNNVKVWFISPAMEGTGWVQFLGTTYILSYYVVILALCLYYLIMSFKTPLPWVICLKEWENCVSSSTIDRVSQSGNKTSSAQLYFVKTVLQQGKGIEKGLGYPIWYLTVCLLISWFGVFIIVARGIKSSGKVSWFLAIFPYAVMIALLITTCLLKGSGDGILFFLRPQWNKLYELNVWYAAVTQVFFSLSVCTGAIIMFSSYSEFTHNVYRDSMIVTTLDTFTSLLSGITIFGILGNLAHVLNKPIKDVVGSGGTGLAFVSYPDAIAKTFQPQVFAVMFFLMMTVLGVGSAVALLSTLNTVMIDMFPKVKTVYMSAICCTVGFATSLVYVTNGGQYIIELVDYYGGTFLMLFSAISEIIGVCWIYGLENFCIDIQFMLERKTSVYFRICWGFVTPILMIVVFIYALFTSKLPMFGGYYRYPVIAYICGYILLLIGAIIVPIVIIHALAKHRTGECRETIISAFEPSKRWGPRLPDEHKRWKAYKVQEKAKRDAFHHGPCKRYFYGLFGLYAKKLNRQ